MAVKTINTTLAADLVGGGTLVLSYPAGTSKGTFSGSLIHKVGTVAGSLFQSPRDFTLTFAATTVTINWTAGTSTIPAGTAVVIGLAEMGYNVDRAKFPLPFNNDVTTRLSAVKVQMPSMASVSTTFVVATQAALTPGAAITQANTVLDFPRNLTYVSSTTDTTQSVTVVGTDVYGVAMTEKKLLTGATPVVGLKAFKTITKVSVDIAMAGNLSIGSGLSMGMPIALISAGNVIKEIVDGAVVTNGTFVNAITAKSTNALGDVRGTYTPNTASDGTHSYELLMLIEDYDNLGQPQV